MSCCLAWDWVILVPGTILLGTILSPTSQMGIGSTSISLASHHFKMRERFLFLVQQGGGRLSACSDQNDLNNYEKNEVRKVTNLHNAESESFCNKHLSQIFWLIYAPVFFHSSSHAFWRNLPSGKKLESEATGLVPQPLTVRLPQK